jgi:hypothetical protein
MTFSVKDYSSIPLCSLNQSCSCSSSVASSTAGGHDDTEANKPVAGPVGIGRRSAATNPAGRQHQQQREEEMANNNQSEYTLMDKVSCSSDSFSHLAVPHPCETFNLEYKIYGDLKLEYCNPILMVSPCSGDRQNTGCPEEICSYTSDSGDSCYSSMVSREPNIKYFY